MVERRRVGRIPDDRELVAFVLAAVGNGRVGGVRDLEDQLAERAVDRLLLRFLRTELLLQRARGRDLHRSLVGRGAADLLRRRVLAGPQPVDFLDERAPRLVEGEDLVDQSRHARACVRYRAGTRALRAVA